MNLKASCFFAALLVSGSAFGAQSGTLSKSCKTYGPGSICVGDSVESFYVVESKGLKAHSYKVVSVDTKNSESVIVLENGKTEPFEIWNPAVVKPSLCLRAENSEKFCVGDQYPNAEGGTDSITSFTAYGKNNYFNVVNELNGKNFSSAIMTVQALQLRKQKVSAVRGLQKATQLQSVINLQQKSLTKEEFSNLLKQDEQNLTSNPLNHAEGCDKNFGGLRSQLIVKNVSIDRERCEYRSEKGHVSINFFPFVPGEGSEIFSRSNDRIVYNCPAVVTYDCELKFTQQFTKFSK